MHVSLDRFGRAVVAGEGTFRTPMGVEEVDNTLSKPVSQAEALYERGRMEYATMAAMGQMQDEADAEAAAEAGFRQRLAQDYRDYTDEYVRETNGGEHPLLYMAALQSMAGAGMEHQHPLTGYGLTQDGQIDWARGMSGRYEAMGQDADLTALVSQAQQISQAATQSANNITNGVNTTANSPAGYPLTSAAPASGGLSSMLSQKVAGIPVVALAACAVAAAAFLMIKKPQA